MPHPRFLQPLTAAEIDQAIKKEDHLKGHQFVVYDDMFGIIPVFVEDNVPFNKAVQHITVKDITDGRCLRYRKYNATLNVHVDGSHPLLYHMSVIRLTAERVRCWLKEMQWRAHKYGIMT